MWKHGEIPIDLGWKILVIIPNGNTNTRRIGLLETLWKVVEAIVETRLRAIISFQDVLHGLRSGRGTGTAILELKLAQYLAIIDQ